ncbi:MAG: hypothetical protein WBN22_15355 [Verrucomicrobiia bacterium]
MASEPTNDGLHDEVKTVTIRTFSNRDTAGLAAANLEAHGIECWVNADDGGGMYPNLSAPGGVRLLVRASDAEAAIALLNAQASPAEMNQIEAEATASASPETVPPKKPALVQIVSGLVVGIILGIMLCLFYQRTNELGTKTHYHYAADGKRDEAWVYRNGYLVEFLKDRNHDRKWDEWTYYENGRVVRSEYDNNFDGKPDEWWTFSNGIPVSMQKDTDFNGVPDCFCTYKDDIIHEMDMRPNGAKFTTVREIFQNGVLTEVERGGDSNGNFKEKVRYDPFFNPVGSNPINTKTNSPAAFQLLTIPAK